MAVRFPTREPWPSEGRRAAPPLAATPARPAMPPRAGPADTDADDPIAVVNALAPAAPPITDYPAPTGCPGSAASDRHASSPLARHGPVAIVAAAGALVGTVLAGTVWVGVVVVQLRAGSCPAQPRAATDPAPVVRPVAGPGDREPDPIFPAAAAFDADADRGLRAAARAIDRYQRGVYAQRGRFTDDVPSIWSAGARATRLGFGVLNATSDAHGYAVQLYLDSPAPSGGRARCTVFGQPTGPRLVQCVVGSGRSWSPLGDSPGIPPRVGAPLPTPTSSRWPMTDAWPCCHVQIEHVRGQLTNTGRLLARP